MIIIKVETERANLTQPDGVVVASAPEIEILRTELIRELGALFQVIPESDKRDCIELSVVIEKVVTRSGTFFVGSSAIAVGKGDNDLLYTHNPIFEPDIKKVAAAVVFQLSMIQLQALLPSADTR